TLTRLDTYCGAQRLVLESTCYIDVNHTSWQPALTRPIDVRVRHLTEPDITSDIEEPARQVVVDVVLVTMRLVWHAFRRAKVHPTRHGAVGVVVEYCHVHPVASAFQRL